MGTSTKYARGKAEEAVRHVLETHPEGLTIPEIIARTEVGDRTARRVVDYLRDRGRLEVCGPEWPRRYRMRPKAGRKPAEPRGTTTDAVVGDVGYTRSAGKVTAGKRAR